MNLLGEKYCLDSNILIVAWQNYYAPSICPTYWDMLNHLGSTGRIFMPQMVFEEISRAEDDLSDWLKSSTIPIMNISSSVTQCLRRIYEANPDHKFLVDAIKQRSLADPWVIAHAMSERSCVVTKENKVITTTSRIKIPNVCENMGIRWIDDFQFVQELNIEFSCSFKK